METRWRDLDALRHVNHATFLTLMESARLDLYRDLGMDKERWLSQTSTILGGMEISWLQQVNHPSKLDIGQRLTRIGTTSFDLLTGIFRKNESSPVCIALFKLITFDFETNSPVPVPNSFHNRLNPFER